MSRVGVGGQGASDTLIAREDPEPGLLLAPSRVVQWKQVHEQGGQRTFVVVLAAGDDVMGCLLAFAREQRLRASSLTAIGALERVTVAFFDWQTKAYQHIPLDEQVEVLSLVGDIGEHDGQAAVHAHIVVGRRDGTTRGGHLVEATARPTLEVVIVDSPAHLSRRFDPGTGLNLIRFT